jgi:argininosuccinate lyase
VRRSIALGDDERLPQIAVVVRRQVGGADDDAHEAVAHAVRECEKKNCDLADLSVAELRVFHALVGDDVHQVLTLEGSVAARDHIGGTAPVRVRQAAEKILVQTK